jgi:hypothetical protein
MAATSPKYAEVSPEIVRRLAVACAHLPEAYEEDAWTGIRWRIRGSTLVHVVSRFFEQGPVTYMTFHSVGEESDALLAIGDPFYPGWGPGLIAMRLTDDDKTDWEEVKELVTESYRLLAPKKLVRILDGVS